MGMNFRVIHIVLFPRALGETSWTFTVKRKSRCEDQHDQSKDAGKQSFHAERARGWVGGPSTLACTNGGLDCLLVKTGDPITICWVMNLTTGSLFILHQQKEDPDGV